MLKIRFLILGLMLGLTALAQDKALDVRPLAPRRAAVLFANQNYQVDQYDLRNSSNDADDMKAALERIGFKVLVYKKDLGRVDLDREIRNLRDLLKGYSVVFFYYSGHGGLYQDENYMIPADVPVLSDNAEVKTFGVSLNGVYAVLREAAVPIGIVVSDACRNLVVSRGVATGMMLPTEGPSGTFTMFATRYGKTARENLKGRNGYFTQELLKHLETPGQTLDELYRTTREGVKVATAHLSERQVPGSVNELDDDYVLVPGKLSITPNPKGQKPEEPLVRPTANRVAVIGLTKGVVGGIELAEEASVALAKQYPGYTFVAYEKGQQPKGIPLCEVSEWTENDPDNIYQSGMYKFKSKVVLEVRSGPKPLAGKR